MVIRPWLFERPEDDRLWVALLRVQGRRGDALGLESTLRRLRTTLVQLGHGDKPDTVRLPPNVTRVLDEVQEEARRAAARRAAAS